MSPDSQSEILKRVWMCKALMKSKDFNGKRERSGGGRSVILKI